MQRSERIENALRDYMANDASAPLLLESMAYGLLDGGKRIRPQLLLLVSEMLGGICLVHSTGIKQHYSVFRESHARRNHEIVGC